MSMLTTVPSQLASIRHWWTPQQQAYWQHLSASHTPPWHCKPGVRFVHTPSLDRSRRCTQQGCNLARTKPYLWRSWITPLRYWCLSSSTPTSLVDSWGINSFINLHMMRPCGHLAYAPISPSCGHLAFAPISPSMLVNQNWNCCN